MQDLLLAVIVIVNDLQRDIFSQIVVIFALLSVMLITFIVFYSLSKTEKFISKNMTNIISRVMAIILSGLSIQFIINGIKAITFLN